MIYGRKGHRNKQGQFLGKNDTLHELPGVPRKMCGPTFFRLELKLPRARLIRKNRKVYWSDYKDEQ